MEDLTKHQIILLTLLVSFVTSIATGIVTVSLIDQAPASVTKTVNRIVERTIEKVVPAETQSASVVTKETVVVKADDLVVEALEKNAGSVARIQKILGEGETAKKVFAALALIINKEGMIVTDSSVLSQVSDEAGAPLKQTYVALFPNGKSLPLKSIAGDNGGVAIFAPIFTDEKEKKEFTFTPAVFADSSHVKLGQTVIALLGEEYNTAQTGIVATLTPVSSKNDDTPTATSTEKVSEKSVEPLFIKTDLVSSDTLGAVLLNLSGEVVGMKVGPAVPEKGAYLPANPINTTVAKMIETSKKPLIAPASELFR
jgi:S1-C subfamily serine protease